MSSAAHSISQSHNQTNTSIYKTTTTTNANSENLSTSLNMIDTGDTNYEIKTEFYTREGVWKQVSNGEYIRQLQQQQQQQNMSPQYQQMNGSGSNINNGNNQQTSLGGCQSLSSNDSVRIGVFKYSRRSIFKMRSDGSSTKARRSKSFRTKLKCSKCHREQSDDDDDDYYEDIEENNINNSQENSEYDDDDDVIFSKVNNSDSDFNDEYSTDDDDENDDDSSMCKYCKQLLKKKRNEDNDKRLTSVSSGNNEKLIKSLDLMLFNYAREIYFYEFNPFKLKVSCFSF